MAMRERYQRENGELFLRARIKVIPIKQPEITLTQPNVLLL